MVSTGPDSHAPIHTPSATTIVSSRLATMLIPSSDPGQNFNARGMIDALPAHVFRR
jgi:hypothetical protein